MVHGILSALDDPEKARLFARHLMTAYLSPAFGARSKSEIDLLVFDALTRARAIEPNGAIYDLARTLNVTPAKARALVLSWQLRSPDFTTDLKDMLIEALKNTRFSKDGSLLAFGIESPLLREDVIARLKKKGIYPDTSFSRDLVRLPVEAFVEFIGDFLDGPEVEQIRKKLVADKQLPDRSVGALVTGILTELGKKVAGKAGEELVRGVADTASESLVKPAVERITEFVRGLLGRDADMAVGAVLPGEFTELA